MQMLRTIAFIVLGFLVLRLIGRIMSANRAANMKEEGTRRNSKLEEERERLNRQKGKTFIDKNKSHTDVEDVDFEEID